MFSKRIRLSAAVFIISSAILMASASEVKAIDREYARCYSGRCIKATGYIGGYCHCGGGRYFGPAIFMLDLVEHYIAIDHESWHDMHFVEGPVDIYYYGFGIRAEYSAPYRGISANIIIGLPGGARLSAGDMCDEFYFYGFATYYNRREYVPF